jgi:hypothetical protein
MNLLRKLALAAARTLVAAHPGPLLLVRFFATPNEYAIHGFCEEVTRLARGERQFPQLVGTAST